MQRKVKPCAREMVRKTRIDRTVSRAAERHWDTLRWVGANDRCRWISCSTACYRPVRTHLRRAADREAGHVDARVWLGIGSNIFGKRWNERWISSTASYVRPSCVGDCRSDRFCVTRSRRTGEGLRNEGKESATDLNLDTAK